MKILTIILISIALTSCAPGWTDRMMQIGYADFNNANGSPGGAKVFCKREALSSNCFVVQ